MYENKVTLYMSTETMRRIQKECGANLKVGDSYKNRNGK